jgi:hypothetical protein
LDIVRKTPNQNRTGAARIEAGGGCRVDLLRKVNGACKVTRRTIVLDANVLLDKNLSVFL